MIDTLMPFLMLGILVAAILTRPLERLNWVSISAVLVVVGFISSEIWVGLGKDTGLRWEILRDLVFYLLLPILIFEAAISVNVKALRREAVLIFSMAIPLLLVAAGISACIFQFLMNETIGGNWALALLMGSMICATDPTTLSGVLNSSKSDDAHANRAANILEGESLINDGTTITLFVILAGVLTMTGEEISFTSVMLTFLITLLGGAAVGAVLGWLFDKMIGPLNDHVLTTSATLVLAFASFWIGEHLLGLSGVVATLTAGLTIAWRQRVHRKEMDIAFAMDSWRIIGFCANAMLFFLVGMSITLQMFVDHWMAMLVGILAGIVSRAIIVYAGAGPISYIRGIETLKLRDQNLLLWGGVRGAIAIALALSLSLDIPHWYTIQSMVYGVALFSLVIQTPMIPWLVVGAAKRKERSSQDEKFT